MRRAISPPRRGMLLWFLLPCGQGVFALQRSLGRLPGVGQRGPVRGCARQPDPKPATRCLGRHRRYGRRAERHGYQSLTARQSRDLLLISGRVACVNTPAPLASPPKHPQRKFSDSLERRGHAARAAGASFPRCAQSGDLPPRRVNARVRFRFGQNPFQPNILIGIVR